MRGIVSTSRAGPGGAKQAQEIVPHTTVLSCHHTGITGQLPYSALQCQGNGTRGRGGSQERSKTDLRVDFPSPIMCAVSVWVSHSGPPLPTAWNSTAIPTGPGRREPGYWQPLVMALQDRVKGSAGLRSRGNWPMLSSWLTLILVQSLLF